MILNREDYSFIKECEAGKVYELPNTVNWIKLLDYVNLNLSGPQIWVFAYLDYNAAIKKMTKTLSKRTLEDIVKGKCRFGRFDGRDFSILYRSIFLDVTEYKSEWLIIKNSERFMDENRSFIQEIAQEFNLKVIVMCKEQ